MTANSETSTDIDDETTTTTTAAPKRPFNITELYRLLNCPSYDPLTVETTTKFQITGLLLRNKIIVDAKYCYWLWAKNLHPKKSTYWARIRKSNMAKSIPMEAIGCLQLKLPKHWYIARILLAPWMMRTLKNMKMMTAIHNDYAQLKLGIMI